MTHTIDFCGEKIVPGKILCIGRNYADHARELGNEVPDDMVVFLKPASAIGEELFAFSDEPIHYEGELCFLVRNRTIAGVGFGLDLTKRELQNYLKQKGLPWERAKAFSGAALFSPFVPYAGDPNALSLQLYIDGELVQQGSPNMMLFPPHRILEGLDRDFSLKDNDIVMSGTPKGVGVVQAGKAFEGRIVVGDTVLVSSTWLAK